MSCLLLYAAYGVAGHRLSVWLGRRDAGDAPARGPLEAALWACVWSVALAVASGWLLLATGLFRPVAIASVAVLLGAVAVASWAREPRAIGGERHLEPRVAAVLAPLLLAGGAWVGFVLWRGQLLPVGGNDALSYHLPRAIAFVQRHGWAVIDSNDPRVSTWPVNFEVLLAEVLALDGGDRHATWLGTATFLMSVIAAGAIVERWWGGGLPIVASIAVFASAPIALLHSGIVKNDLLTSALFLAAFLGAGELAVRPQWTRAAEIGVALALAVGTKVSAIFAVISVVACLVTSADVRGAVRRGLPARLLVPVLGVMVGLALLLGSGVYLVNLVERGSILGIPAIAHRAYGDWGNLWKVPTLLVLVPFSSSTSGVWVPWLSETWFWGRYDPISSHFGIPATALLVLVPLGVRIARGQGGERRRELLVGTAGACLTFALLLPTTLEPEGFFCTFSRFLLFIVPIIAAWTIAPVLAWLDARPPRGRPAAIAIAIGCVGAFGITAWKVAVNDLGAPLADVRACAVEGICEVHFAKGRACFGLNRVAAPDDVVAIDAGFDSWISPCYGPTLGRKVTYLKQVGTDVPSIPSDAKWVVVDRMWNITWGDPAFTDFGKFRDHVGKGYPTEDELRVYNALLRDPRFKLRLTNEKQNQAVFERVPVPAAASAPR